MPGSGVTWERGGQVLAAPPFSIWVGEERGGASALNHASPPAFLNCLFTEPTPSALPTGHPQSRAHERVSGNHVLLLLLMLSSLFAFQE